ncbi:MAG: DUF3179 domain-containing protein [Gammaproteobacteria bacterium]|nr:DUF3179 domain-containing protein [Gammaproteobacteria bacterium]
MKYFSKIFKSGLLILAILIFLQIQVVRSDPYNGFDLIQSITPKSEIYNGGPPKDGIPALIDPEFERADDVTWLDNRSRVLGIELFGIAKAYPLNIMTWHEIVNDQFGKEYVVVTYCPLCFSGMAFNARIDGNRHLFGVSGLLYNSDVLLYDDKTESLWTQIGSRAISGKYVNRMLTPVPLTNTTWGDWRSKHPVTLVLSRNTGYVRDYTRDPYEEYKRSPAAMFPVSFRAQGYHPKEPVIGIILGDQAKAYPVSELSRTSGLIEDNVGENKLYVVFNRQNQSADIFDQHCNKLTSVLMYWFAWFTFHPDTGIFKAKPSEQHTQAVC